MQTKETRDSSTIAINRCIQLPTTVDLVPWTVDILITSNTIETARIEVRSLACPSTNSRIWYDGSWGLVFPTDSREGLVRQKIARIVGKESLANVVSVALACRITTEVTDLVLGLLHNFDEVLDFAYESIKAANAARMSKPQ